MTEFDDVMETLEEKQSEFVSDSLRRHYMMAAEDEMTRLENMGLTRVRLPVVDESEWYTNAVERVGNWVDRYRTVFANRIRPAINNDDSVEGELMRIFDGDGLVVDLRGETEPIKRVQSDGDGSVESREIDYVWVVAPHTFFEWIATIGVVEARNAGRMDVHRRLDTVERQVWISPLTDDTTPMEARLHGTEWDVGEVPFLPPVTHHGAARLHPMLGDRRHLPSQERLVDQRERWFARYHAARQGEIPMEGFTDSTIDVEDVRNMEFIYRSYLPRRVKRYRPTGGDDSAK